MHEKSVAKSRWSLKPVVGFTVFEILSTKSSTKRRKKWGTQKALNPNFTSTKLSALAANSVWLKNQVVTWIRGCCVALPPPPPPKKKVFFRRQIHRPKQQSAQLIECKCSVRSQWNLWQWRTHRCKRTHFTGPHKTVKSSDEPLRHTESQLSVWDLNLTVIPQERPGAWQQRLDRPPQQGSCRHARWSRKWRQGAKSFSGFRGSRPQPANFGVPARVRGRSCVRSPSLAKPPDHTGLQADCSMLQQGSNALCWFGRAFGERS